MPMHACLKLWDKSGIWALHAVHYLMLCMQMDLAEVTAPQAHHCFDSLVHCCRNRVVRIQVVDAVCSLIRRSMASRNVNYSSSPESILALDSLSSGSYTASGAS